MRFFFLEEKFKMEMNIGSRLKHAWNAFLNRDPPGSRYYGGGYSYRPDRMRFSRGSERTIINAIYNRIALDAASITINHVKLDENNRFDSIIDSGLNYCLNTEANADQTGRGLIQDIVMTFLEEGVAAVVPEKTNFDPRYSNSYEIYSMRVGVPVEWYPNHVRVRLFNELTGQKEEITFPKKMVALIENPFYAVMNAPNSTMQQLVRKLALLDVVDEQAGSGKLDMIIQLPYVIKSPARREQAEQRRADIEHQLSGSKYGIAYTDGTERIVQLNRSLENNILKSIEYLTNMVYSQLGVTQEILNGTADEKTMNNYMNRIIEPVVSAIADEFKRKFLTKTARTQGQSIMFFRDPFRLAPVSMIAEMADKFTRNEIMTPNEFRQVIGMKPSKDPKSDQLANRNIASADEGMPMQGEETYADEQGYDYADQQEGV
nr:MAG TPA: portal protein [Caudoviricetes sp.]